MDIEKDSNREAFEAWFESRYDAHFMQFALDLDMYVDKHTQTCWEAWQAAKAQAVPEWIDYSKQSPRIDGPYQIFIMNQQLVAEWESPWGFSSIEDGDALNQELITHWSVLGSDPVIEAQEPAND